MASEIIHRREAKLSKQDTGNADPLAELSLPASTDQPPQSQSDSDSEGPSSHESKATSVYSPQTGGLFGLGTFLTSTLNLLLPSLPQRWRDYLVRTVTTLMMLVMFVAVIYGGPLFLVLLVLAIQLKCYSEIIGIGHRVYRSHKLPWFRTLAWYFLFAGNYAFVGDSLVDSLRIILERQELLRWLFRNQSFVAFLLYLAGLMAFVSSLVKKYYLRQFLLFGWTHVTLLLVVLTSHCIIANIFHGLIWIVVPSLLIIGNDIFAYLFGFFFGRHPLIQLSPKKTWEGFIGGAVATVIAGQLIGVYLSGFEYFTCPIEYDPVTYARVDECQLNPAFQPTDYHIPLPYALTRLMRSADPTGVTVTLKPFNFHLVVFSLFASLIGPFGGFFASGFKRAFRIKDFGDVIPGHGGVMDRFDCQTLMGIFVNVYYNSFVRVPNSSQLLAQIRALRPEEQMAFYNELGRQLALAPAPL